MNRIMEETSEPAVEAGCEAFFFDGDESQRRFVRCAGPLTRRHFNPMIARIIEWRLCTREFAKFRLSRGIF